VAVLEDAACQGIELESKAFWSLGDVVGYGPHPVEALMFLKHYVDQKGWVMGNHDAMLADLVLPEDLETIQDQSGLIRAVTQKGEGVLIVARGLFFTKEDWGQTNSTPIRGIELNRATIAGNADAEQFWRKEFVCERKGPLEFNQEGVDYVLVHGSQEDPLSRYIYPWHKEVLLQKEFALLENRTTGHACPCVQFFGHTHVPTLVRAHSSKKEQIFPVPVWPQETYSLETELALVNPGSVGQPRNLDQRACYVILDTVARTVTFRRVDYDWRTTARDLQSGNFPSSFVSRLKTARAAEKETPDDWLAYYQEAATR
jgi:diadenosine tetraphosphatase ApaH/serine/threonine PP2A family protein phosphatase